MAVVNLDSTPPLWWDEGWTLSVARNWTQIGHYGRLLSGNFAPPGLEATFPISFPVSLCFYLFGIGVWQGRLAIVAYLFAVFVIVYLLAKRLYNSRIAIATIVVLILVQPHAQIHPIIMGRQVLGEIPALFYLLIGYLFLLAVLEGRFRFFPLVIGFWGIALVTKAQVLPFWTASILLPAFVALLRRNWRSLTLLMGSFVASFLFYELLLSLWQNYLQQKFPIGSLEGMYEVTAAVTAPRPRTFAASVVIIFALPTIIALVYAGISFGKDTVTLFEPTSKDVVKQALLVLASSWLIWYVSLSVGWFRYLFPPVFIASIFVAHLLDYLTNHFNLISTIERSWSLLRCLRITAQTVTALIAVLLITISVSITVRGLYHSYAINIDNSTSQTVQFLNSQTSSDALIETYDSELFFLLERRYHYPPDQIHVELNRRTFLHQDVPIEYDPLAANPDYLVVGPQSKLWKLYDAVLKTEAFRLVRSSRRYEIYERVRE
jgi:hypothetical protein